MEGLKHRLQRSDDVSLVSTTGDVQEQVDRQMGLMYVFIGVLLSFGSLLAGSVIHSVASVSLVERTRELATLRSLGFSAARAASLAAIELAVLAIAGLAVGIPLGIRLNALFMASFTTENMAFRPILYWWVYLVTVAIVAGLVSLSSLSAVRTLRRMDLAQATKTRD